MSDQILIQGIAAGSTNEVNVAYALSKLELQFDYQYVYGIYGVRGSQIIDFLVYTVPKPTPLFVHGRYWHTGKRATEDKLKMAELESQTHRFWDTPVIIWEEDCETVDDAIEAVRKELMF